MHSRTTYLKMFLLLAATLAVAAAAVVYVHSRRSSLKLPVPVTNKSGKAVMALAKVRQTATKEGKVRWELNAETAELEADSGRMSLRTPEIDFILDDGSKVHLKGSTGTLDTRNNDIDVQGNVRVHNGRYTLGSETLSYRHERRILKSDTPVSITGDALELRANAMIYDLTLNEGRFDGSVEGYVLADLGK